MALEKLQRKYAKDASRREAEILVGLEEYYRDKRSLGSAAERANIPLRAIMEYMQEHKLPYYSGASDAEEGLRRISEIRSTS